jgi:hypothetical protein
MPWPNRIYLGKFKLENSDEKQPISPAYATQMQIMINALNEVPVSANKVSGTQGIGVLISNSMMFQRFPTHEGYEDPQLSNFYGMALPLLKRGVPVETVHMENLLNSNALKNIKVLVMSYSNMKPLQEEFHDALAKWVKGGGVLLYYGRDNDPFQNVQEWWNSKGRNYKAPSEDLFKKMGISVSDNTGLVKVGKGWISVERKDPKEFVMANGTDNEFVSKVKQAFEVNAKAGRVIFKNNFQLQRGPYIVASVMDENEDNSPLKIKGPVIDLFDPTLPVMDVKEIIPGKQAFLYDLKTVKSDKPRVLAAAARAYDEKVAGKTYSFTIKSPSETINSMRLKLPAKPKQIDLNKSGTKIELLDNKWDERTKTLLLRFQNFSEGVDVKIEW